MPHEYRPRIKKSKGTWCKRCAERREHLARAWKNINRKLRKATKW